LVAYDGSPQAQRATELAFSVAEAMQSKVLIFAVIRPPEPAARAELNAVLDDAREHYEQSFTQLREQAKLGLFGTGSCEKFDSTPIIRTLGLVLARSSSSA
jgi:nucleotide-binding universal stress UspA family protein